jgi:hypothetical protein
MKVAQQIVGVNNRLGNTAVAGMQGTTRYIYDSQATAASTNQTLTFFQGASSRTFPATNINNNRFEVGESLAIQGVTFFARESSITGLQNLIETSLLAGTAQYNNTLTLNLFVGNQRVIKDLDLNYSRFLLGEVKTGDIINNTLHFETPIVIPPQIEFYATLRITSTVAVEASRVVYLGLFGQGTLLNTKSTF